MNFRKKISSILEKVSMNFKKKISSIIEKVSINKECKDKKYMFFERLLNVTIKY